MKTLVCTQPYAFEYQEWQTPKLQKDHALLKLRNICVCGTDLHAFEGTQPYFTYPRILGHELSAELIDVDGAPDFTPGEAVTFLPYHNCEQCIACRMGKPNCCAHLQVFGVHKDGGMVEYLSVPARLLVHGQGLSYPDLALVEPLAIGAHGITRAQVQPGEFVLVVGAGPIGLGTILFALLAGARVIAMDVDEKRLTFSSAHMQVPFTVNARDKDVLTQVRDITDGDMPTVVIDATGNQNAINNGLAYLAHGGRYVLIGLQKGDLVFNHPEFHKREATLMSSRNASRADFDHVISAIKSGTVHPRVFINNEVRFGAVKDQFREWLQPANGIIKTVIEMD